MAGSSSQAISIVSIAGDTVADVNLSDPWFADHVGHLGESNSVTTIAASVLKKHLQDLIGSPYYTQQLCLDEEVDVVQDDFDIQPPAKFTLVRLPYVEDNSACERLRGAAGGGDAQAVLRELRSPSHPDGGVDDVTKGLCLASEAGHLEIVLLLHAAGADKDKVSLQDGLTPLFFASEAGHLEIVRLLVSAGSDKDKATLQDDITPLFAASRAGHLEIVRLLVSAGADKDKATLQDDITPLFAASQAGHLEIVRFLVSTGRVSRLRVGARRVPIWK
ncbi:unnamed protein product [Polarella glacialis]|uniref:Uncharacterized protein n=1 Tax=Polarella glacialis TaxID=89957 RepID=A0A813DYE7_POLGL|nr:unnamed protein product [Polarella glacialis]CAE8590461.1 unnamed protein product [Polarella glacialis]